jgi:hypothetical protein
MDIVAISCNPIDRKEFFQPTVLAQLPLPACFLTKEKINSLAIFFFQLITLPVSSLVVDGLAKIFDFKVLRHGTTIPSYFGILREGADPSKGGTGSACLSSKYKDLSKGYFHVFKDGNPLSRLVLTKMHACLSGVFSVSCIENKCIRISLQVIVAVVTFFCPPLRFMYRPDEIRDRDHDGMFKNDFSYGDIAMKTKSALPNDRIGLVGIAAHARWSDFQRACGTPLQVLMGVIMLIAGSLLTLTGIGLVV